jgi:FtsP/CotA-like multicopper oxidase with cupredoxin domain
MSIFDVRVDGLPMTVVQADGNDVAPVTVDEFRISVAETYDVIVQPKADRAYTIFVQAEDRSGYARGILAPRPGMTAPIPPMGLRPMRTMAELGMGSMDHGAMSGMDMGSMPGMNHGSMQGMPMDHRSGVKMDAGSMPGMDHGSMPGMNHGSTPMDHGSMPGMSGMPASPEGKKIKRSVEVDNVAEMPTERLNTPGEGSQGDSAQHRAMPPCATAGVAKPAERVTDPIDDMGRHYLLSKNRCRPRRF